MSEDFSKAMRIEVRPAGPEDAAAICRAHQGSVETWFRYPKDGPPVPVEQEELDEYGLWLNGGPWMVPRLCRAHLEWLLSGVGLAWVGLLDGEIVGEGEAFLSEEPPPLGRYLDLSVLYVHRQAQRRGVGRAIVEEVLACARRERCDAVLIGGGVDAPAFYARMGFAPWQDMVRARVDCPAGQEFGHPFAPGDYCQVAGLPMPIGRQPSARQNWEEARAPAVLPAGLAPWRRDWRFLEIAGEPVWAAWVADLFEPTRALLRVWSRAPLEDLLPPLLRIAGALGYRQAELLLPEEAFGRLQERFPLAEAGRHQAWWLPLSQSA